MKEETKYTGSNIILRLNDISYGTPFIIISYPINFIDATGYLLSEDIVTLILSSENN